MDYFNAKERLKQKQFAQKRDRFFYFFIKKSVDNGISKDMVSFLGVLFLVVACIVPPKYTIILIFCLAMYLLCDALDGGIARYSKTANQHGSVIDIICDQLGVIFLSISCIFYFNTNIFATFIFSQFYIAFIILVVYFNQKNITIIPFVRVKYPFYLIYVLTPIIQINLINYFIILFSIYYFVLFFYFVFCLTRIKE